MSFQFEKNKLYAYLGKELVELLKKYKVIVAGGTITSLLSNKDINDIDVYFRNEESIIDFVSEIWGDSHWVVSHTKKATQFAFAVKDRDAIDLQLIHFEYFNSPEEIFKTFDYTVCMGAFDFEKEEFVLHEDFLKHNSQRLLKFNSDTAFPIVSMLRVQKYENKGYKISKPEFIRIILTCMNLDINTYEELKEQMGGMYGINYDKLFEDVDDEEFDLQQAIDKISDLVLDEEYFKKPVQSEFDVLEDILDNISKKPKEYLEINGIGYIIDYDKTLRKVKTKPEHIMEVNPEGYFKENKYYKFVKKAGERYFSYYDDKFEYVIGQEVVANRDKARSSYNNDHAGKLHLSEKYDLQTSFEYKTNAVLIEVEIKPEDFLGMDYGHVLAKKCVTVREVPKTEWKNWENEQDDLY